MTQPSPPDVGRGVRLGVDVGTVRIGVAICDPDGILATPVMTLARAVASPDSGLSRDMEELARLVNEHQVVEIVVGLPVSLAGRDGPAARARGRLRCRH